MPIFPPNDGIGVIQTVGTNLAIDTTTTSQSYVALLTQTVGTIGRSSLLIRTSAATSNFGSLSNANFFRVTVDGAAVGYAGAEIFTCVQSATLCVKTGVLAAGVHTVTLDWRTQATNTLRDRKSVV